MIEINENDMILNSLNSAEKILFNKSIEELKEDEYDAHISLRKFLAQKFKCDSCGSSYIIDNTFVFTCGDCGNILPYGLKYEE